MKKINNLEEFELLKKNSKINIIKFGQEGCMPCSMVGEIFEKLDNDKDNLLFSNVEFYECENVDLMKNMDISNLPVVYIINNKFEERIEAYSCIDELEEKLSEAINWLLSCN